MNKAAQILILFLLVNACISNKKESLTLISGNLPKMTGEWIYAEELEVKQVILLDSVQVDSEGHFEIGLAIKEEGFYLLRSQKDNYVLLVMEPGKEITLNSSNALFMDGYEVFGSDDSKLLKEFELFMISQKKKVDSLAFEYNNSKGSEKFYEIKKQLDSVYLDIYDFQREYVINFIETNPTSLVSLIVINRKLGNNKILDEEEDFIYFHRLDSALMSRYPTNKHTTDNHKRIKQIRMDKFDRFVADKKLEPGKKAPNIVLKDTSGQFISLKDLAGKKVLIYFWAGWNAKSRQDNRRLLSVYPGLQSKGIEILGVSLDENKKVWKGAISLDKTPWLQGSDLLGMDSKVNKDYNLMDELPYYYMVNEERKIIFRDNDLAEVINKLDKLF
jgi:hypothetical protein